MEYYNKAKQLLDMDAVEFTGTVTTEEIKEAEQSLGIIFPESYKAFLLDFGAGDIGGEVVFGIVKNKEQDSDIDMVRITQEEYHYKMPKQMAVIFYDSSDDSLYCLDTDKMKEKECPVVRVPNDYTNIEVIYHSFGEFFYQLVEEDE